MSRAHSPTSRVSTMVSPAEAYRIVLDAATPLPARQVPLLDAMGRPLAESVHADRDYPPFRRAMMDGYAVSVASAGQAVAVVGRQPAGSKTMAHRVTPQGCVEIMTGAACPPGTEAVVQKEHIRYDADRVVLPVTIPPGLHIAGVGSDCPAGEEVILDGAVVTPLAIAALASLGRREIAVIPAPRMALIVTGEELVVGSSPPRDGQIRDSNSPMLAALALESGLALPTCRLVGDDRGVIRAALDEAGQCDLVVLSGGASVGTFDLVPEVLLDWGAEILFHKVVQKPGKPLLLARRGRSLLFGLPGNPLACHFCFCRYVRAAIAGMGGRGTETATGQGHLLAPLQPDRGRTRFVPAVVQSEAPSPDGWTILPLSAASSADIFHSHEANAYVEVPPGQKELPIGHTLSFSLLAHRI